MIFIASVVSTWFCFSMLHWKQLCFVSIPSFYQFINSVIALNQNIIAVTNNSEPISYETMKLLDYYIY